MAILTIHTFPDSVLRQKAQLVDKFDEKLKTLVSDMLSTMYDAPGVGLAANQVGVLKCVIVIDIDYSIRGDESSGLRAYENQNPRVFINPKLTQRQGEILYNEGCLSVPGFNEEVKRSNHIEVTYQDMTGQEQKIIAEGFLAVALQHEMDHLEGKLFIDRLSAIKKSLIKGKIKKERSSKFERSRFHVDL